MRNLVATAVVALLVVFFMANGYIPLPDGVRNMWDKAWHNKVEPAKDELDKQLEKQRQRQERDDEQHPQSQPAPERFNLGSPTTSTIDCTVVVCSAA